MIFSSVFLRNCIFLFFKNLILIYAWKSLPPSKEMSPEKCAKIPPKSMDFPHAKQWYYFGPKNKLKVIFLHIKCQELIYKNANLRMHTKNSKNPPSNVSPGRQITAGVWQNLRIPIYWLVLSSLNVNQRLTKKWIPDWKSCADVIYYSVCVFVRMRCRFWVTVFNE